MTDDEIEAIRARLARRGPWCTPDPWERWCELVLAALDERTRERDVARAAGYAEGIAAAVAWLRDEADGHERRTHETGYLGSIYHGSRARWRARVLRTLAHAIAALPPPPAGITVTSAEFRADAHAAILSQTEPLDDAAYAAAAVPTAEEIRAAMAAGAEELRRLMRSRRP